MRPLQPFDTGETRAEVARRRLAQLAASFDAEIPREKPDDAPVVASRRIDAAHLRVLVTIAVAAGVLLTWWLLSERPRTSSPDPISLSAEATSPPGGEASSSAPASGELVVDVEGKVKHPGIVTLPAGSRVHEAVAKAGGVRGKVDTSTLNMARVLMDGEQILVGVEPVAAATRERRQFGLGRRALASASAPRRSSSSTRFRASGRSRRRRSSTTGPSTGRSRRSTTCSTSRASVRPPSRTSATR